MTLTITLQVWHTLALAGGFLALASLLPGQRASGRGALLFVAAVLMGMAAIDAPSAAAGSCVGLCVLAAFVAGYTAGRPSLCREAVRLPERPS